MFIALGWFATGAFMITAAIFLYRLLSKGM